MDKYQFNTISNSVKSKEYYNLETAMSDAEKICLEKQEDVQLWEMPGNQFKPNAFVFVHWRLLKTYVYKQLKISTEVNDTMGEDEEMKNNKIALCKMFSGEYWSNPNNIGYESINLFLPDGEQGKTNPISYMYLPADGDYNFKNNELKYIVLTQHIAKKTISSQTKTVVKVLGLAEVEASLLQIDCDNSDYKCLTGGREFDALTTIYEAFAANGINKDNYKQKIDDQILNKIIVELKKKISDVKDADKLKLPPNGNYFELAVNIKAIKNSKEKIPLEELAEITKQDSQELENEILNWLKDNHKKPKEVKEADCFAWAKERGINVEIYEKNILNFQQLQDLIWKQYQKALLLREIHDKQIKRIRDAEKPIKYNRKYLDELFGSNSSFGSLNILTTLKVKDLKFPQGNIYITNDKELLKAYIPTAAKVIEIKENPSAEKQTTYIKYEAKTVQDIRNACGWSNATELKINQFSTNAEPSFLTVIKKENDELSYSNLFEYFFKKEKWAKEFFRKLTKLNIEILQVDREEANVDILVKCKDRVIVIENKIKSALNGHIEEDANGEKFHNQLTKYYKYVEDKYPHYDAATGKSLNKYYIFAPDYNPIKTEKFGKVDSIEMKNVWNVIEYSKISDACKVLESLLSNAEDKWYFKQFQKALNVHSEQSLNYYREMQIRMRKLFN